METRHQPDAGISRCKDFVVGPPAHRERSGHRGGVEHTPATDVDLLAQCVALAAAVGSHHCCSALHAAVTPARQSARVMSSRVLERHQAKAPVRPKEIQAQAVASMIRRMVVVRWDEWASRPVVEFLAGTR